MSVREDVLSRVAVRLAARRTGHPLRLGIDGVVGAGKSTFARDLVAVLRTAGLPAVHLDSDGFHHVRAIRYRQGRDSARGYYEDAYDFEALAERVLRPLGTPGSPRYATKVHDLETDALITGPEATAEPGSIVVFDCTFLQRGRLRELWDEVIWLEADRDAARQRGISRDLERLGGEAATVAAYESRYMAACDLYLAEERPSERASIVIDHNDPARPRIVRL